MAILIPIIEAIVEVSEAIEAVTTLTAAEQQGAALLAGMAGTVGTLTATVPDPVNKGKMYTPMSEGNPQDYGGYTPSANDKLGPSGSEVVGSGEVPLVQNTLVKPTNVVYDPGAAPLQPKNTYTTMVNKNTGAVSQPAVKPAVNSTSAIDGNGQLRNAASGEVLLPNPGGLTPRVNYDPFCPDCVSKGDLPALNLYFRRKRKRKKNKIYMM